MTKLGHERLTRIIRRITRNPKCWYQEWFRNECGTAFCVAGHAIRDAKQEALLDPLSSDIFYNLEDKCAVIDVAARYLSLNDEQAESLFRADNTLDDIKRLTREFAPKRRKKAAA